MQTWRNHERPFGNEADGSQLQGARWLTQSHILGHHETCNQLQIKCTKNVVPIYWPVHVLHCSCYTFHCLCHCILWSESLYFKRNCLNIGFHEHEFLNISACSYKVLRHNFYSILEQTKLHNFHAHPQRCSKFNE